MRQFALFVLLGLFLASCSTEDVAPSLSDKLVGNFEVTNANFQGTKITLPLEAPGLRLAINLEVIRQSETVIDLKLITETTTDGVMSVEDEMYEGIELFENESEIVLSYQGTQMGTFNENRLIFESESNGVKGSFTAMKK